MRNSKQMETLSTQEYVAPSLSASTDKESYMISQAIENYYLKGIFEGDLDLLRQVYHSGTLLFGDVKGKPYFKTLNDYFQAVGNRLSPKYSGKPFKGELVSVRIINSIAVAELKVMMYDFYYHEFLSFHRVEGRWLIVNKMMSDLGVS